jgi:hypothetical protein
MNRLRVGITQVFMGGFAGVVAALVKYISHDHPHILELIELDQQSKIPELMIGYAGGAVILFVLGAVAVWWSSETDSLRKMFAIGLSAPALFASALPTTAPQGSIPVEADHKKASWIIERIISSAYAQQGSYKPDCIGDNAYVKGFKLFLGMKENIQGYRVVIGSYLNPADAAAKVKAVNAEDPTLNASVGLRRCDNDYTPALVGPPIIPSLDDAKKLAAKANKLDVVSDVFISPVPVE